MTERERELIAVIESLPRDDAELAAGDGSLNRLPIVGVLRGAHRLHAALLSNGQADRGRGALWQARQVASSDLQQLLEHPDSVEVAEARRRRTGVDWHLILKAYVNYPGTPLRRLAP